MLPTLRPGDLLLVRGGSRASPGDLVVVRLPGDRPVAVKRLVALVPEGWWVERDNPAEGVDSWVVGAVPEVGMLARVVLRLHPRLRVF
jgi:phage repressor protein C with HTH and peptisase S24 domain